MMLMFPSTTTQLEDYPYSSSPGGWTQPGVQPPGEFIKPPSYDLTSPPGAASVELGLCGASQQQYPGRVIQVGPATGSAVQSPPPAY